MNGSAATPKDDSAIDLECSFGSTFPVESTMDRKGPRSMKRSFAALMGTSLALLLLAGSPAWASFVGWDYAWSPSSLVVAADGGSTGGISLTLQAQAHADGTSDIIATNLRTFSSAPRTLPDSMASGNYTLTLSLTDTASGQSGTATFSGFFSGTFSTTSADVHNTFTGATTETLVLGGHTYKITIGPYAPPGPPSAANAGTISAHVDVDQDSGNNGDTPEPSTLVLSCLGVSFLGAAGWRKWKRGQQVAAA